MSSLVFSALCALTILGVLLILLYRGVAVKKKRRCPKDKWTALINNYATGMPRTFSITLKTINGSPVTGEFLEQRSTGVFTEKSTYGPLTGHMRFHRHWLNRRYKVFIKPTCNVEANIE